MSSRRGGRPFFAANNDDFSSKGKGVSQFDPKTEQLTQGIAYVNLGLGQDDGRWETFSKKTKNRGGGSGAAVQWGPTAHGSNPRAWVNTDMAPKPGMRNYSGSGRAAGNPRQTPNAGYMRPAGRGNGRPQPAAGGYPYNGTSNPIIRPPLEGGWNWRSTHVRGGIVPEEFEEKNDDEDDDDDDDDEGDDDCDDLEDTDDDLMSDEYDSDASQKSHETRKKSKWFRKFFQNLDNLTLEQINDPERQWHCAACQGGPGAIDWYSGLQPLMNHAKTKGSKRVKVHRELAVLLDEELRRRGTTVVPAGEAFGKWKGLKEEEKDHEIVWPPMVIIQNTKLEQDENDKWTGMGNQELLDYFSSYAAVRARHSYGPQGHRGMSVLMFEASASGYLEAERLHKHFSEQGTNREAWFSNRRNLFLPGGNRQLFGYMAAKEDLEFFNRHCQGKTRLKYEMKSYQEMVVHQIRQMSEDNQQLLYLKNKMVKEKKHSKALEESFGLVTEKLRKTMEENRIVRRRTKMQHEEIKEEMYEQEQFFKERISSIHDKRNAKEEDFERMQQEEREKVKKSSTGPANAEEERRLKVEGYLKFVELQDKEMENFVEEKEKLCQVHKESIAAMRKRHWEEEEEMEKKFDEDLAKLMEKYSPSHQLKKSNGV